ncbi:hypothetical protein H2200_001257 [Cladophialophora chaetospira]|uniref:Uncharacterized protein n=1 Tax=Cladophialophora chaetospira TaxID=386627 RepID=A0AA38XKN6_9EURO|nr:hypothetical protein H2200_001257 [Cladophialophora chaetospira]
MLALTVIGLAFTYISLSLSSWTAQKDFRDNCFNQQQTFGWMTRACNETLSEQLQQPPHFSGFYRSKRSAFPDTISRRDDIPGRLNGAIGLELVMCVSPAVFIFFNNQGKENHRRGSALSIPPLFYSGMKRACGQISAFILVHSLPMTFGQCWWPFRLYYMLQILRFLRIFWVETELDIYRGTHLPAGNLLPVKIAAKRSVTYGNAEFETLLLVKLMEGCLVGSSRILFCYGFFAASIDSTIFVTGFLLVDFFFTCIEEEQEDATTSSSYLLRALPQTPLSIYQQHVKTVLVQT